jgi:lycopene cyclase CruA
VIVVDRARAAQAHREWNASDHELQALVRAGLCTEEDLASLIIARYSDGTCRFHGGGSYPVKNVLDVAVDAGALLALGRKKGQALGVRYLDFTRITAESSGPTSISVALVAGSKDAEEHLTLVSRVLIDARGAASPYASADLVCPTVGGVLSGLCEGGADDEMSPTRGEILATVDAVEDGRQHVWEAFPGAPGQTTVYLFYYAVAEEPASLLSLYDRFFRTLPAYKRGDSTLLRPTFGLIPGWSRLGPAPAPPKGRIMLVGDAAARHSPLTYCGFGAALRSFQSVVDAAVHAAQTRGAVAGSPVHDAPAHALTGALAHMISSRAFHGNEVNELLDAAFATLHASGEGYARLLRDQASPGEIVAFLQKTSGRHPAVWGKVLRGLGLARAGRWGINVALSLRPGAAEPHAS